MRSSQVIRLVLAFAAVCLAVTLATCGGKRTSNPPIVRSGGFQAADYPADTLDELAALETPTGVDEELFQQLKDALGEALQETRSGELQFATPLGVSRPGGRESDRNVSTPPIGEPNRVTDLAITDNGDSTFTLSWHYRNLGDYDQNGTVDILDILSLAEHYGEEVPDDDDNSLQAVIDGSGNGIVDIADITPLAMNYGANCAGYSIQTSDAGEGPFTEILSAPLSAASGEARRVFDVELPTDSSGYARVLSFDCEGTPGVEGIAVQLPSLGGRGDWWMFGREPTHNRRSPYVGAQFPNLKWRYQTERRIESSPAIGLSGTIYVGSWDGYVYAITPQGTLMWKYETGGLVGSSPAIGEDGTVYVGSYDHYLYAISPDGTLKWRYEMSNSVTSSPAIGADGTIYVGGYYRYLYAIIDNEIEGTLKWRYETDAAMHLSCPAVGADGTVYVGGGYDNCVYAFDDSGTEGILKWQFETSENATVTSSPAIGADGTIYVGCLDNYLYAINPDGTLRWRYLTGDWVLSSPAIAVDGTIYVGSGDHFVYAIEDNETEGSLKWRYCCTGYVLSSPAIGADGTVYVGCGYNFVAISPIGTLKWEYKTDGSVSSSPAIGADGSLYVGNLDGYLYAFGD